MLSLLKSFVIDKIPLSLMIILRAFIELFTKKSKSRQGILTSMAKSSTK
ncbi:hypothetical protein MANES_14G166260v8 [Manihot esculenta]|uniref:Uncharacterized protein n=1 Tax=Manihot esculenta TaxID=3983 RepID=A0ACB7GHE7_MANES|nr:hypothetical protein MANES_14G166260v8 [Manihot esculenta]